MLRAAMTSIFGVMIIRITTIMLCERIAMKSGIKLTRTIA